MEPPIDPSDHTVSELEGALEDVDDPEALDAILEAEHDAEDRTTAIEAIEARLDAVETAIAEDRAAIQTVEGAEDDVLTLAGPDESHQLSERLLNNLSGIQQTLQDARQSGGQYEARLRKLENEVGDLSAYTDALEEFLDEDGTAQQILESVQGDIEALEEDIDDVKPVVRSHAKTLRDHRMSISEIESELDSQAATLTDVGDDVDSLDARFEQFSEDVAESQDEQGDRIDAIEAHLDDQVDRIDDVASDVSSVADSVDDVAAEVETLETTIEEQLDAAAEERSELDNRVADNTEAIDQQASEVGRVAEDIDDRVDQLEEEIEAVQEWRNQLGSVLGGGSEPDSDD